MKSLLHESSSNLHSSRYDPDTKELFIVFMDQSKRGEKDYADQAGKAWKYAGVEPELYDEIETLQSKGESVGKLFHSKIRNTFKGEPVK